VVAVTSQWADGSRQVPLGVKPYRPASRLLKGRKDPAFHTKPDLAWQLIEDARAAGIPFRLVVADSVYGENLTLEARLSAAQIPDVMGLRPSHGTWQEVPDPAHPPAVTPAEAAARLPIDQWERTVRSDRHGQAIVRSIAELELGPSYGPTRSVRLVAATLDPVQLTPESTWYLAPSLPLAQVSAPQVYERYRLRDGIEPCDKPVKHELGWADYQVRPERAMVRHWQLVLLAYTFSLLVGAIPSGASFSFSADALSTAPSPPVGATGGGKIRGNTARALHRGAGRLGRDSALGPELALPLGAAAALLATLVQRRPHFPSTRAGRAPRPPRQRPPA
jgi:DDE superfamily endonuclease